MDWPALKSMECPMDYGQVGGVAADGFHHCENEDCEFKIGEDRLQQLLDDMEKDTEFSEQRQYD